MIKKSGLQKTCFIDVGFLLILFWIVLLISGKPAWCGFDFGGMKLPPGFKASTYFTGNGFDPDKKENAGGIPAIVSFVFDRRGNLYFARTANRLREIYDSDSAPIYRVPFGTTLITPKNEKKFLFGPEIKDPDEVAVNSKGDVFVSSSDLREGYGSVYRLSPDGKATLFAGGRPGKRTPVLFMDPDGIAFDPDNNVYVIDRDLGVVVKLDPKGKVINRKFIKNIGRGRTLTYDPRGFLWVGSDGPHFTPHEDGSGMIYRASLSDGKLKLLHSGPLASGMSLSPGGNIFAAQRRSGLLFALTPEGKRVEFASFSAEAALRTLVFPPNTKENQQAGIAGDLFVMVFPMLDYPVREIIRISGPFDEYVKKADRRQ